MHPTPTTIYALASAHGKAGVSVFRISGPAAASVLAHLGVASLPAPRVAALVRLAYGGAPIDHALALWFPAPHSFTGEDVLELHTHGSRAVMQLLLAALAVHPALRLAEAGEFARRAFLHGKFDLLEAEGLADLIDAETPTQHAQAMRQLDGAMSARVGALREAVLMPLALLEAYIDFPEEDIPDHVLTETAARVAELAAELRDLLADGGVGEKIREGLEMVIFGAPNAGKSSLLNALARRDVAIVSPEAGTTRDMIELSLQIDGYAVTLVDTAGLREAEGLVEAEGIRRAQARMAQADVKIALVDSVTIAESFRDMQAFMDENTLILYTKSDLAEPAELPRAGLRISTQTGQGMDALLEALKLAVHARMPSASPLITRARHREALGRALHHLERFHAAAPLELLCEELRRAAVEIGKITGKISTDDLLDVVFSRFCIGK